MTVKDLAHVLAQTCNLYMVEIDTTNYDRYPRGILSLSDKDDIQLIEQIGNTWKIDRIDIEKFDSDLLYITYRKRG